jgi:hypothetical protein
MNRTQIDSLWPDGYLNQQPIQLVYNCIIYKFKYCDKYIFTINNFFPVAGLAEKLHIPFKRFVKIIKQCNGTVEWYSDGIEYYNIITFKSTSNTNKFIKLIEPNIVVMKLEGNNVDIHMR